MHLQICNFIKYAEHCETPSIGSTTLIQCQCVLTSYNSSVYEKHPHFVENAEVSYSTQQKSVNQHSLCFGMIAKNILFCLIYISVISSCFLKLNTDQEKLVSIVSNVESLFYQKRKYYNCVLFSPVLMQNHLAMHMIFLHLRFIYNIYPHTLIANS